MKYEKFKDLIDTFLEHHCNADGCKECHEQTHTVVTDDNSTKKLFKNMGFVE